MLYVQYCMWNTVCAMRLIYTYLIESNKSSTGFSVGLFEADVPVEENRDEVCKVTSGDGTLRS
jgi:hypothetical protein